jgi:hypothetical protein
MWRRYGDAAYTLVTLAIFGFETLALGALSLSFLLGKWAGVTSTPIEGVLLAVVVSAASALAMVGLYLLSYQFVSKLRDRRHAGQLDTWTERWIGLALADDSAESIAGSPRSRRLPRAAVHAVLSLLEAVKGEEGDRLKAVLARHGVDRWLLRHMRSGHLTARLDVEPAKITFHGRSRQAFANAAEQIIRAYGHLPQFRGLSVDDLDAYMAAE